MSEKSFHRSWISQFGLYRYDDNFRRNKKECNICFYGITGTASIIIVTVFIFITNTDFDPPKRLIILSHENKSHINQLSTASVLMQQIPTNFQFDSEITVTTPLSVNVFRNQHGLKNEDSELHPQKLELRSYHNLPLPHEASFRPNRNVFPNHRYDVRRQVEELDQPRPFDYIIRGTPPTAFQRNHLNSSSFPQIQIPKEYVGTVNSIQDILRQVSDKGNNYQDSNGMHKIKIAGTYKHRKVDDITNMFESTPRKNRGQVIDEPAIQSHSINSNNVIRDPFYKYKPNSLSDVNLMATNQVRFAPYNILGNKYVPMGSTHSMDPGNLYHQIIMANQKRLKYSDDNSKKDNVQSKQKPFTLMLDVYPMPDDEHISSTVQLPLKYQNHFNSNMMRHPGISTINNLQPYFHSSNFAHLNANRYPNLPHYNNHNYFRKFGAKPLHSGVYTSNDRESNNPSQITVHLNLFPKKKEHLDHHNQNAEILNKGDSTMLEKDNSNSVNIRLQERMAKLGDKVNRTEDQKDWRNENPSNFEKVTNKVDMDVLHNTSAKQNVIMIDESSDVVVDSSENIFNEEFLQFHSTDSPTEFTSDSTTFESKSVGYSQLIPTILPIEPRRHGRQLDKSLFNTLTVH